MALPFRTAEDALLMSLVSGAILFEMGWLTKTAGRPGALPDSRVLAELGQLKCRADAVQVLAAHAAVLLDRDEDDPRLDTLPLFLRTQTETFQRGLKKMAENLHDGGSKLDEPPIVRDIDGLLGIGRNLALTRMRRAVENLLKPF